MIAKVVVKGRDRDEAIKRLDSALSELQVVGVTTNVPFIRKILGIEEFSAGHVDTGFIGVSSEPYWITNTDIVETQGHAFEG